MDTIIYKKYEENRGFEEYQAEIYNSVAKKVNTTPVTVRFYYKKE